MKPNAFKDLGWSLQDFLRNPAREGAMHDMSKAAHHHASIQYATFASLRLWSALGGGPPRLSDLRLKEHTWTVSFALCGLTRLSQKFRPFARVVRFRYGTNSSRILPYMVAAAVVHQSSGRPRQLLLLLHDEI